MNSLDWLMMFIVLFLCVVVSWYWSIVGILWIAMLLIDKWVDKDWSKT